jgi:hypothetical protein
VTVTVSEQRGSEQASRKSEATEKKAEASKKSSAAEAADASTEDISRLLLQVQELLMERLPKGEEVEEEDLTAEDVAAYAKVRAFLLGRRRGGLGSLIENVEEAVAAIAEARDEIDDYLEAIDLEQDRGRSCLRTQVAEQNGLPKGPTHSGPRSFAAGPECSQAEASAWRYPARYS